MSELVEKALDLFLDNIDDGVELPLKGGNIDSLLDNLDDGENLITSIDEGDDLIANIQNCSPSDGVSFHGEKPEVVVSFRFDSCNSRKLESDVYESDKQFTIIRDRLGKPVKAISESGHEWLLGKADSKDRRNGFTHYCLIGQIVYLFKL